MYIKQEESAAVIIKTAAEVKQGEVFMVLKKLPDLELELELTYAKVIDISSETMHGDCSYFVV